MKKYQGKEKKVQFNGREVTAFFVKNHSRLKGLVFEWIDANHDDEWANISRWVRYFGVMEKDSKEWKMIPGQHPDYMWASKGMGIFQVLHCLELPNVRNKIETEDQISELKDTLKYALKEIKSKEKLLATLQEKK